MTKSNSANDENEATPDKDWSSTRKSSASGARAPKSPMPSLLNSSVNAEGVNFNTRLSEHHGKDASIQNSHDGSTDSAPDQVPEAGDDPQDAASEEIAQGDSTGDSSCSVMRDEGGGDQHVRTQSSKLKTTAIADCNGDVEVHVEDPAKDFDTSDKTLLPQKIDSANVENINQIAPKEGTPNSGKGIRQLIGAVSEERQLHDKLNQCYTLLQKGNSTRAKNLKYLWTEQPWILYLTCLGQGLTIPDINIACIYFTDELFPLVDENKVSSSSIEDAHTKNNELKHKDGEVLRSKDETDVYSSQEGMKPKISAPADNDEFLKVSILTLELLSHVLFDSSKDEIFENLPLLPVGSTGVTKLTSDFLADDFPQAEMKRAISIGAIYLTSILSYLRHRTSLMRGMKNNEDGDATAAFFRACTPKKTLNLLPDVPLQSSASATNEDASQTHEDYASVSEDKDILAGEKVGHHGIGASGVAQHVSSLMRKFSTRGGTDAGRGKVVGNSPPRINKNRMIGHGAVASTQALRVSSSVAAVSTSGLKEADVERSVRIVGTLSLSSTEDDSTAADSESSTEDIGKDYTIYLHREMLGLTVENVLERTIIRTVLPHGAAKKSGAKIGSLIVQVGSVETKHLTHFETIDELRQSNRPLKLILRRVGSEDLVRAREEMGRLIRGGVFGSSGDTIKIVPGDEESGSFSQIGLSLIKLIHDRWGSTPLNSTTKRISKRDKQLDRMSERLILIMTLFVVGLDYELSANRELIPSNGPSLGGRHVCGDKAKLLSYYIEAGRSIAKIILEFVMRHVDSLTAEGRTIERCRLGGGTGTGPNGLSAGVSTNVARNRGVGGTSPVGRGADTARGGAKGQGVAAPPSSPLQKSALWQIGDVLHRARSFLADLTTLLPSAILQVQLIGFLCDVLDFDTGMELNEFDEEDHSNERNTTGLASGGSTGKNIEDHLSKTSNGGGGVQDELGAAGSLLKLVVRSSCMEVDDASLHRGDEKTTSNVKETSSSGNKFLAVVHRLAASRSTSARITACSLAPVLWGHLDFPHQLQLRGVITRALHDVEVVVRKSTAAVLHEIAELVFDPRSVPWLVLMCERAMTDPEPQLRSAAMTLTWHLAEHLPNAFLGDASQGSRSLSRLPARTDPTFAEVYLLQCKLLPVATRLGEDRHPSVRLAVAAQCDRLCGALGDYWFSVIIDLLQALLSDESEQVRAEATLCLPRLVESVLAAADSSPAEHGREVTVLESLLPPALKLRKDSAVSVRVSLATSCGELLTLLVGLGNNDQILEGDDHQGTEIENLVQHKRHVDATLIPLVQELLQDPDPEVTSAALRAVTNASRGNVKEISHRRSAKIEKISPSSPRRDASNKNLTNSPLKEPVFIPVLSEEQVLRLLPTLSDLATSSQWRVRQSAVEIVPALLGCTKRLATRTEIAQLCVTLMKDKVDAVRKTAAECLCLGGGSLGGDDGGEWINSIVIPNLIACRDSSSSKQRMLCLKMVEVLVRNRVCHSPSSSFRRPPRGRAPTIPADDSDEAPLRTILEVAASLSFDKVVNVRLNVGKVLGDVAEELASEDDVQFVIKILEEQAASETERGQVGDRDVLYFSKRGLTRASAYLTELSSGWTPSTPVRRTGENYIGVV